MPEIVEIVLKATDQTSDAFKKLNDNLGKSNKEGINLTGTFKALSIGAVALGAALTTAIVASLKLSIDNTLQWGEQLDRLVEQFGMTGEAASGFALAAEHVGLNIDEMSFGLNFFTRQLDNSQKSQVNFTQGLDKTGKALTTTSEHVKDNTKQIAEWKKQLADAQVNLQRAQHRMSEAKAPTDAMRYAVEDAKKKIAELNDKIAKTPAHVTEYSTKTKEAIEPTDNFSKALRDLGVSMFNAQGKAKSFDEMLPEIMDKFSKLPPGINASALAMDLFGARGGSKFLDFLRQGSAGIAQMTEMAKEIGKSFSTEQVDAVKKFSFSLNDLRARLEGIGTTIGIELLPYFKEMVDFINNDIMPGMLAWVREALPGVKKGLKELSDTLVENFMPILQKLADDIKTGNFSKIPQDIGDLFGKIWTYAKPALNAFIDKVVEWANDKDTQEKFRKIGGALGGAIVQGLKDYAFDSIKNINWGDALMNSIKANPLTLGPQLAAQIGTALGNNLSSILGFQSGGVVPGPIGQPQLAVVHGGETVLPAGRGGGITVYFTYAPAVSLASQQEAQNVLQPFIEKGIITARSRQIGATR